MNYKYRAKRCSHGFLDTLCLVHTCEHAPPGRTKAGEVEFRWADSVNAGARYCMYCGRRPAVGDKCDCQDRGRRRGHGVL